MEHKIKIWPQFYKRVADGSKTFEIRNNDRNYQQGDIVVLCEWDPQPQHGATDSPRGYTDSKQLKFKVGYVHVLDSSRVVFSLVPIKTDKKGNVLKLV